MKTVRNIRKQNEINRQDLRSLLLWKAFRKIIRQETAVGFLTKLLLLASFIITLMLFQAWLDS